MEYRKTITLKDGRNCIIRNGLAQDGNAAREVFLRTHGETDYLLTYPDETRMTGEQEAQFLKERTESLDEVELVAEIDGCLVGTAGIRCLGRMDKIRHRAEFGIGILRDYWGLGIGRALTESCLECARAAGYAQLELDVVAENAPALALYQSLGFTEYGRNPRGFRSRRSGWQELVLMRLELDPGRDCSTILK
ncbi:MAG: GNAT family N-acetyltransferase [Firmicutes bacterium]|nr:GNAT family N-acetyltransferase [Bacillota bacterium]